LGGSSLHRRQSQERQRQRSADCGCWMRDWVNIPHPLLLFTQPPHPSTAVTNTCQPLAQNLAPRSLRTLPPSRPPRRTRHRAQPSPPTPLLTRERTVRVSGCLPGDPRGVPGTV
jgi:hypothetical protein